MSARATGIGAIVLAVLATFVAVPPFEARSLLWPVLLGVPAAARGVWAAPADDEVTNDVRNGGGERLAGAGGGELLGAERRLDRSGLRRRGGSRLRRRRRNAPRRRLTQRSSSEVPGRAAPGVAGAVSAETAPPPDGGNGMVTRPSPSGR